MRIGTIGSGGIVTWVMREAVRMEGVVYEAVYSRSETTGRALASQWAALEALGFQGGGLYRYASLWRNPARADLAAQERGALAALWQA